MNGGFLSALGGAFMGYGKDRDQRLERDRQAGLDAEAARFKQAQVDDMLAGNRARDAQLAQAAAAQAATQQHNDRMYTQAQADEARKAAEAARAEAGRGVVAANLDAARRGDKAAQNKILAVAPAYESVFKPQAQSWAIDHDLDEQGNPRTLMYDRESGQYKDVGSGRTGTGAGGVSKVGSMAPIDDMMARYGEIAEHGKALGNKQMSITPFMQAREGLDYGTRVASASGHPSFKYPMASGMMKAFGMGGSDQEYERFRNLMASTRAFGDDAAKVFKGRQNEVSVAREIALAQLTDEDYGHPDAIARSMARLRSIITLAKATQPAGAAEQLERAAGTNAGVQSLRDATNAGTSLNQEAKPSMQDRVAQLVQAGFSKQAARAQLVDEGYNPPP